MLNTHKFTTKNGLKVLLVKRPEKYSAGISLMINSGSIYEDETNSGISHFFEHLFFGGTPTYNDEEKIIERSQEIGFSPSARTSQDFIEVWGITPKSEIEDALSLLSEMVFNSRLDEEVIEKERNVILSEIRMRKDDNQTYLWESHMAKRFKKGNPLAMPIGGNEESVIKITKKQIDEYYKKFCVPSNSILVIGSNWDFERLEKIIRKIFEIYDSGKLVSRMKFTNDDMSGFDLNIVERPTDHIYLNISFPSRITFDLYENSKGGFLSVLISDFLGRELRSRRGIVYSIGSDQFSLTKDIGILTISTSFAAQNLERVIDSISEIIEKIKIGEVDMVTLERIRETGNRTFPMAFDSLGGAMSWVVSSYFYDEKIFTPEERIAAKNKITKEDIVEAANTILDFKKVNISLLGKVEEKSLDYIKSKIVS